MKIGVAGLGVVGGALAKYLENTKTGQDEILKFDPSKGFEDDLSDCRFVFICVPAPTNTVGWPVDTTNINDVLMRFDTKPTYFIRSTVVPGTCDAVRSQFPAHVIHSMPEFISERTALEDLSRMPIITSYDNLSDILYMFPGGSAYHRSPKECEMIKYAHNVHGAVKVAFFNVIYGLCESERLNYNDILEPLFETGHVDKMYTKVPGPDGRLGFGGHCFPKDTLAFERYIKWLEQSDREKLGSSILHEILDYNDTIRGN